MSNIPAPFYKDVYKMVDDPSCDSLISWSKSNKSFIVWRPEEFSKELYRGSLARKLQDRDLKQFMWCLKEYGFKRIKESGQQLEFGHEYFVRGQPELLKTMQHKSFMKRLEKARAELKAKEAEDLMQKLRI